jgi:predicted nucleic acid-binding Zn ribbon protein
MTLIDVEKRVVPKKPEPFPRWLIEDYVGSEQDRADCIFATVYWKMREEIIARIEIAKIEAERKGDPLPLMVDFDEPQTENDFRVTNQLYADALNRATLIANENKEGFDRAFLVLSEKVNRTGSYRFAQGEYGSFEEWVVDNVYSLPKGSSELSNFMYYHNELSPLLFQFGDGFTSETMLTFAEYKSKGFAAIPFLREKTDKARDIKQYYEEEILKVGRRISKLENHCATLTEEDAAPYKKEIVDLEKKREVMTKEAPEKIAKVYKEVVKAVEKTVKLMKDPAVPAWDKVNGIQARLKRTSNDAITFKGSKMYVTDVENEESKVMFLVATPTKYEQAVESMLRGLVDFSITDGEVIVEMAKEITKGKGKSKRKE